MKPFVLTPRARQDVSDIWDGTDGPPGDQQKQAKGEHHTDVLPPITFHGHLLSLFDLFPVFLASSPGGRPAAGHRPSILSGYSRYSAMPAADRLDQCTASGLSQPEKRVRVTVN